MNAKVTVILPAYNEQGKVGSVIDQLISIDPTLSIIVVDDGSSDSTYNEASDRNIIVVKHIVNSGQWAALRTGFHVALLNHSEYLVTVDADGQHSPENLFALVSMLKNSNYDLVLGSRFLNNTDPEMKTYRFFGIKLFNLLMRIRTGYCFTDCTSGYKAYKTELLRKILPLINENQYGALESLIIAHRCGAKIKEIPIKAIDSDVSNKGGLIYGYNLLRTIFKTL